MFICLFLGVVLFLVIGINICIKLINWVGIFIIGFFCFVIYWFLLNWVDICIFFLNFIGKCFLFFILVKSDLLW